MKKQKQTFLMKEDEYNFSIALKREFDNLIFLDNSVWDSEPDEVSSIDKCKSRFCYIWNRSIFQELPTGIRKDGRIQGPTSGVVIQFERCEVNEKKILLSGRIAVGFDEKKSEVNIFINSVWKILRKMTHQKLYHTRDGIINYTNVIREYSVGKAAMESIMSNNILGFKHRSTENYYIPVEE